MDKPVGGWVVQAKRSSRSKAPRYYLVAVDSEADALALTRQHIYGDCGEVSISGVANAIHFKRRNMKSGDVCEIGGGSKVYSSQPRPR